MYPITNAALQEQRNTMGRYLFGLLSLGLLFQSNVDKIAHLKNSGSFSCCKTAKTNNTEGLC